jgi:peptidoglycan/LPS O-acetylase OafA/YrhL
LKQPGTHQRVFGLDILRASAILFVLQIHSLAFIRPHANVHYYWMFILDGVDLFFVLSGFLIGGIIIRMISDKEFTGRQLVQFWTRRWFRTLPNYFLILIVLLGGYYYAFHHFPGKTVQFFFFSQSFSSPHPDFFPEAWSLAVEEWFYLLVPLGLFLLLRIKGNKKNAILLWICFVLVTATVFRLYKVYNHHYTDWDKDIRKQVLTRLDSIMYGFLGAWLYHYKRILWEKRKTLLFIAGLILLFGSRVLYARYFKFPGYAEYIYISTQSIGTLMLLPKLNSIIKGKGILFRAVTFISIISYSMYLLNYTIVLKIIMPAIIRISDMDYQKNWVHSLIAYVLFWSVTIFLSYLLYRFYEKPMMNLRERFKQKQEGTI